MYAERSFFAIAVRAAILLIPLMFLLGCGKASRPAADADATTFSDTDLTDTGTLLSDEEDPVAEKDPLPDGERSDDLTDTALLPDETGDDLLSDADAPEGHRIFVWTLMHAASEEVEEGMFDGRNYPAVTPFEGRLWLFGGEKKRDAWRSDDGVSWTLMATEVAPSFDGNRSVVVKDDLLWTVDTAGVWNSADGVEWSLVQSAPPFGRRWSHALTVFEGALWFFGGSASGVGNGDAWRSTDGVSWAKVGDWQPVVSAPPGGYCEPLGDGLYGPVAAPVGDRLIALGGHFHDSCYFQASLPGYSVGWSQYYYADTYTTYATFRAGSFSSHAIPDIDINNTWYRVFGSYGAAVPFDGDLWVFAGQWQNSDTVQQDIGPGAGPPQVWPGGLTPLPGIAVTADGIHWEPAPRRLPLSQMYGFGAASFNDAVWLIGGNGGNAIWRGSYISLPGGDPEAECILGAYPGDGSYGIGSNADAELLRGYTSLKKLLVVGETVTDLSALHCLKEVDELHWGNSMGPADTPAMTALLGLTGLETITSYLYVSYSPLSSLNDFPALRTVGKQANISYSTAETFTIDTVTVATPQVIVEKSSVLKTVEVQQAAATSITIQSNEVLETISWPLLEEIVNLSFNNNPILETIDLPSLRSIGHLGLSQSPALVSVRGFPEVDSIGALWISKSPAIAEFDLAEQVTSVSELTIIGDYVSGAPPRFPLLAEIGYQLYLSGAFPADIDEILAPQATVAVLRIDHLSGPPDLSFLVGARLGALNLDYCKVPDLTGIAAQEEMSYLYIKNSDFFPSIAPLADLRRVTDEVYFLGNDALADIAPLMAVEEVPATLSFLIKVNPALSSTDVQRVVDHFVQDLGLPPEQVDVGYNCDACPPLIP